MTYASQIDELIKEVAKLLDASEGRSRSRIANEQLRFNYAVHVLLTDLWKAVKSTPIRECSINKRSGGTREPKVLWPPSDLQTDDSRIRWTA